MMSVDIRSSWSSPRFPRFLQKFMATKKWSVLSHKDQCCKQTWPLEIQMLNIRNASSGMVHFPGMFGLSESVNPHKIWSLILVGFSHVFLLKISCLCSSITPRDMSFQMLALSGFVLAGNRCGASSGLHLWTPINSGSKALLVHCAKCIGKIRKFCVLSIFLFHHFDVKCQNIAKHPPKSFQYSSQKYPVFPCEEIDFIPINQTTNCFTTQSESNISKYSWL